MENMSCDDTNNETSTSNHESSEMVVENETSTDSLHSKSNNMQANSLSPETVADDNDSIDSRLTPQCILDDKDEENRLAPATPITLSDSSKSNQDLKMNSPDNSVVNEITQNTVQSVTTCGSKEVPDAPDQVNGEISYEVEDDNSSNADNIEEKSSKNNDSTEKEGQNDDKKSDETESEEEKKSNTESGELKIDMVTTLDPSDVFVEAQSGPISPATFVANPLASDKEETSDSVKSTSQKDNCENATKSSEAAQSDHEGRSETDKDNEQVEVITGDKTISSEYVKNNLSVDSIDGATAAKEHGYSKKSNDSTNNRDSQPKRTLKVIYPKRKTNANQLKIIKLQAAACKPCLQCAKVVNCTMQLEINGSECFLCSDDCLSQHKAFQNNVLMRSYSVAQPTGQVEFGPETRLCVNCDANVSALPEEKVLSWETMEFCNEDCLGKYQTKMWSFCTACKKDVLTGSMGKYCVRFGHEVKQFCSSSCLEEFKKGIKVCSYCQKDLSLTDDGFLAAVGEKGQFRDFCSQSCLDEYDNMARNNPPGVCLKVESCDVCDKTQIVQVQIITSSNNVNLCSEVCFAAFKFVNKTISTSPCYMCKKYYEKTLPNCVTVYYENELLSFCSKSCMNINILGKRKIVSCNWCKVKKYNFDMVRRKNPSHPGQFTNWCSVNCMALYQVSMSALSHRSKSNCTYCKKLDFPNLHLTMSDATIRNFCSMECVNQFQATLPTTQGNNGVYPTDNIRIQNVASLKKQGDSKVPNNMNGTVSSPSNQVVTQQKVKYQILVVPKNPPEVMNAKVQVKPHLINKAVSVRPNKTVKGVQTDNKEDDKGPIIIPIPVPIYIPCPMAMYSVPVPTPLPIPIPVPFPIIIPTTRGTADEIMADIKRIQEEMPGNPYEAELLMMAELAESQKKSKGNSGEKEGTSTSSIEKDSAEKQSTGFKRKMDDNNSTDRLPPEKKRKEESSGGINALDNAIHQLAASRLTMSLKETLGVSAWRYYASESGEPTDLLELRPGELAQALKGFISSAKIPGGEIYTPDQKYYLMLGIQYYLRENGRLDNIFFDKLFDPFIEALDEEAKKFQNMFTSCDNIITRVEEEHLWESKELGPHTPATLLATLIYLNTKYFNLSTVEEHMQLSFNQILKHWKRNPNAVSPSHNNSKSSYGLGTGNVLLRFYPSQATLDANSKKKKVYEQEANEEDPYRCPIQLYEFYLSKCPESVKSRNDLFYLSPERSCVPDSPIWYSALPLSEDVLERTLNRLKMVKEINLALLSSI